MATAKLRLTPQLNSTGGRAKLSPEATAKFDRRSSEIVAFGDGEIAADAAAKFRRGRSEIVAFGDGERE